MTQYDMKYDITHGRPHLGIQKLLLVQSFNKGIISQYSNNGYVSSVKIQVL